MKKLIESIMDIIPEMGDFFYSENKKENRGLNASQEMAIIVIGNNKGSIMKEIHDKMTITKGNLSQVVEFLVSAGYVERDRNHSDRRRISLYLTKPGELFYSRIMKEYVRNFNLKMNGLSEAEKGSFEDSVNNILRLSTMINRLNG